MNTSGRNLHLGEEIRYRLLAYVSDHPRSSQRDVARALGVSVGKANYCMRALIAKGLVKVRNFRDSECKTAYLYVLTKRGAREKMAVAICFLRSKVEEYERLKAEIERLRQEVGESSECA